MVEYLPRKGEALSLNQSTAPKKGQGGGYQWVPDGHKKSVSEYGRCILYSYIKIEE
jgi:hypothetical protein